MGNQSGFLYVGTGQKYREQVCRSLPYLKKFNPDGVVTLFTDENKGLESVSGMLERTVLLENPRFSFIDKIAGMLATPYERCVFLDTDTIVAAPLSELFNILDRFEFAACHAPGRSGARTHPYEPPEIPVSFVQFNTGVVSFRNTERVRAVFRLWQSIYLANPHHLHDQPSLREALFKSDISTYVLPPEYNFLIGMGYFSGPVKIFHGVAALENPQAIVSLINQTTHPRVFVPPDKLFAMN